MREGKSSTGFRCGTVKGAVLMAAGLHGRVWILKLNFNMSAFAGRQFG
jgi:hypothetical protein